ncbi:CHAT domain-containing protein, partial [Mycena sp. CBHHK59/15]
MLPVHLQSLAVSFSLQYKRLGDLKDLEAALINKQAVVNLTSEGHPDLPGYLHNLAGSLIDRYQRLGELKDLEAAIKHDLAVVNLTPEGHPDLPGRLQGSAASLTHRYKRLGDLKDLDTAVKNEQLAVSLMPEGHPEFPRYLQSLAVSFGLRFQRLGELADLEAALMNDQAALNLMPKGHPELPDCLQALAVSLKDRYQRLGDLKDLEAAIKHDLAAVNLIPEGHPDRPECLGSLAVSFTHRYQRLGDLKDLEAALENQQLGVKLTPEGHLALPRYLHNLAVSFLERHQRLGDLKDLEAALQNQQSAVNLIPEGHPDLPAHQQHLAVYFTHRHERLGNIKDVNDALDNFAASFKTKSSQPILSWEAAHACIDYSSLPLAIELLEQGLATRFQQMLQLKPNVDGLPQADREQLEYLSSQLYSGTSEDLHHVTSARNALLDKIREYPGFEYFLRPAPYKDLCQASKNGPIVILNAHKAHCDAIVLVTPASDPLHIPLAGVTLEGLEYQRTLLKDLLQRCNESFQDVLAWLWTHVVANIFTALKSHGILHGRLWWCPTGAFTGLPLHAASPSDQFIHSYTSTLGALLEGNSKSLSKLRASPTVGVVGVTHSTAHGGAALPGVELEVTRITSIVGEKQVQSLVGEQATVEAVKDQLQNCGWVHLACHGMQDLHDPPKSHLQLYEGILELETILQMSLSNAEFVFLAACQTAKGDDQLMNESFHLGGGFIAAGFRGAIGTMWSMLDADGPVVAEAVYTHLFADGQKPQASDAAR